jgi:glyoxylase-like metal-dependent hydrolase (beta-lactamase superfamily II)
LGQLYDRAFRDEPDRSTRFRHPALDAQALALEDTQALALEDILVTPLHADHVGAWNSKFR